VQQTASQASGSLTAQNLPALSVKVSAEWFLLRQRSTLYAVDVLARRAAASPHAATTVDMLWQCSLADTTLEQLPGLRCICAVLL
jgi:hypothetical protein